MHGAQKLLGWFGGHGFEPTVKAFGSMMHIPAPLAALSIFVEFFGGIALIVGFLPRLAAIAIAVNMLVAVIVSVPGGFFADKKGFEFPLGLLGIAVALILTGPGQYAILPFEERFIKRR